MPGDVSNLSGFTEEFCWCANHRSISLRRPGSGCLKSGVVQDEASTTAGAPARAKDGAMVETSRSAEARAESYQAEIQKTFSEDSEIF